MGGNDMLKREGHSHTEFCPHGSGDDVELMIQRAIHLGFKEYSITEHAPLPPELQNEYAGQKTGLTEASMSMSDLDAYFKKMTLMKTKYADQIHIHIGFEVDYLADFVSWTRDFLDEYGPRTDDNILSVHFMKGKDDKYWCLDDTMQDFEIGLLSESENAQTLFATYFNLVDESVTASLGQYAPNRIGHMTLIRKFQDRFNLDSQYNETNQKLIQEILRKILDRGLQLDFNAAGLYKAYCNQPYPNFKIAIQAQQMGIQLIYGSDAHSVAEIGHGYHGLAEFF
ncbi:histidinol-phosphatase HisJ [Lentilactobacillus hilgardii]|nr:histidinol-phosphatase HisJ [Lentilactobacillus hilgardii]MCV3741658.1 histidinol-phosphatase HisJ [Lentilactobacillus hilgardii]